MAFAGVNYLAVVVAAAASFVFGGIYYGALSRRWLEATGQGSQALKGRSGASPIAPYLITFACQLVMAATLAGVIGHLGKGYVTLRNGAVSGAFVWLGFVATSLLVNHTFQQQKRALTLIDGGHWLGVLLVQGTIIGWMGVK